ncbi:MAG TPA: polymer-forming cytoskeletal protein [bacterium]|nr:polymer-forming cytoskeletal protein [bacterium]
MIGKKPGLGPDNGEATSVIGENSVFEGTFEVTGNLRVDGKFSGTLNVTETVQVGSNGFVDADVKTRNAVVAGTIRGNLNASEKITLQSGSRLEGEMVTSKLVIEEGVSFQGSCNTAKGGVAAPPKKIEERPASKDDSKAIQDKIEAVAEELSTKK